MGTALSHSLRPDIYSIYLFPLNDISNIFLTAVAASSSSSPRPSLSADANFPPTKSATVSKNSSRLRVHLSKKPYAGRREISHDERRAVGYAIHPKLIETQLTTIPTYNRLYIATRFYVRGIDWVRRGESERDWWGNVPAALSLPTIVLVHYSKVNIFFHQSVCRMAAYHNQSPSRSSPSTLVYN